MTKEMRARAKKEKRKQYSKDMARRDAMEEYVRRKQEEKREGAVSRGAVVEWGAALGAARCRCI